jgi:hypothetical protein
MFGEQELDVGRGEAAVAGTPFGEGERPEWR